MTLTTRKTTKVTNTTKARKDASKRGAFTQRMLYERKREEELRAAMSKRGWEFQEDVFLEIYDQYCSNWHFRVALNRYVIEGKTAKKRLARAFAQLANRPYINRILVFGEVGNGKSRVAHTVVFKMAEAFKQNPLLVSPTGKTLALGPPPHKLCPVAFNLDHSRAILARDDAPGSILYQDEMPQMRGENSRRFKADLNNMMEMSARAEKIHFVFANPELIVPFHLNWVIEVLGTDWDKKKSLCMLYHLSRKTLQPIIAGVVIFNVDEPPELTEWYESMALEAKRELRESAGMSTVEWITDEQDIADVVAAAQASGRAFNSRAELESFCKTRGAGLSHVKRHGFLKDAVTLAWSEMKGNGDVGGGGGPAGPVEYELDYDNAFHVDEATLLASYPRLSEAEMYLKYTDPDRPVKQDILAEEYNIDQSTVSRIVGSKGEVTGWVAEQIGLLYEQYLAGKLQAAHPDAEVIRDGGQSQPDIRMDEGSTTIFYSVKCYNTARKSVSIPIDELRPEIDAARELKEQFPDRVVKCILHLYNRHDSAVVEREVDVKRLPNSLLLKLKK